jgi:hypothetical protein
VALFHQFCLEIRPAIAKNGALFTQMRELFAWWLLLPEMTLMYGSRP